jgi:hypothetical protein
MLKEPLTKNNSSGTLPTYSEPEAARALRDVARRQAERVRSFKLHVVAFVFGSLVLGAVWILTEYLEEHTWPDRFADAPDVAGTWSPWYFWAVGVWCLVLCVHAFKTYAHRPPSEAEIQHELDRLKSRG